MIKVILILFCFSIIFSFSLFAGEFTDDDSFSSFKQPDILRYNAPEGEWSYEKPDAQLKYNPMEKEWEYAEPEERLKYNPLENEWEYAK